MYSIYKAPKCVDNRKDDHMPKGFIIRHAIKEMGLRMWDEALIISFIVYIPSSGRLARDQTFGR